MASREDTGRVDAEGILHASDELSEELSIPYPVVECTRRGRRTVARMRLVAGCTAANSLDIHSDGVRIQTRIVKSSLVLDTPRCTTIAMETEDDR